MAWKVYGPPPEQLAPIVNRVVELARQTFGRRGAKPVPNAPLPQPPALSDLAIQGAPNSAPLRVDPEVAPAAHVEAAPLNEDSRAVTTDELLARLRSLGAVDAELKPWGTAGQTYRCVCRVPSAENPTLERHFDAIATDAKAAVDQVVAEIERWRKRTAI
jgi:hypothetical protein